MLIVGSLAGSLIGYGYIKLTHKDASSYELPFGTFLGLAGIAVAMYIVWTGGTGPAGHPG